MSGRWIAVSADALHAQHELHPHSTGEPACKAFAWIDLIGLAAWYDHGGLKRGQTRAGQEFLATRWNWHRSKVRRFLDEMEERESIHRSTPAGRKPTIITICNYDAYQTPRPANRPANRPQEVPVQIPTSMRARARKNGNGRKPPRSIESTEIVGPTMKPEKVRDILDELKKQVGE